MQLAPVQTCDLWHVQVRGGGGENHHLAWGWSVVDTESAVVYALARWLAGWLSLQVAADQGWCKHEAHAGARQGGGERGGVRGYMREAERVGRISGGAGWLAGRQAG
mgnify:FL=1